MKYITSRNEDSLCFLNFTLSVYVMNTVNILCLISTNSGLDTPQNILEKSFIITPCLEESDTEIADSERGI